MTIFFRKNSHVLVKKQELLSGKRVLPLKEVTKSTALIN